MSGSEAETLRSALLSWYRAHRRELPWRATRDPYAIWLSEAMLQQTRVETVIPYWERFLARFPTVAQLAEAPEAEVLALWSGLGYYRRARALHAAAKEVVERFGGQLPGSADELRTLPGVGDYTAGAIASIAFDRPAPLVDGNVARVFCRLFALAGDPASGDVRRRLWAEAARLVPTAGGAGDWNQGLMELGATICTPREPRCDLCPVLRSCRAHALGRVDRLPTPRVRRAAVPVELELLVVLSRGRLLLEQRPPGGRMAGLWQLPTREVGGPDDGLSGLFPDRFTSLPGAPAGPAGAPAEPLEPLESGAPLGELRHGITHHRIRAGVRAGRWRDRRRVSAPYRWFAPAALGELATTGMTRKALRAAWWPAVEPAP